MILFYTIDCPSCLILEKKLVAKQIDYVSIKDTEYMKKKGIEVLPVLEVDGKLLSFKEAVEWVKKQ